MSPYQLRNLAATILLVLTFACILVGQRTTTASTETISIRVHEGTELAFDLSPDGRNVVFDLLGQLWLLPARGGHARPITDGVRDVADDRDPTFSPDGRHILFNGERNGRTGLWLLELDSGKVRQLTQLPAPEGSDSDAAWSPDGRSISFMHAIPPSKPGERWRMSISVFDVASEKVRELSIKGVESSLARDPVWINSGKDIAFIVRPNPREPRGRVWSVNANGGLATALSEESALVENPVFASDGRRVAYFSNDTKGRTQIWVREGDALPLRVTDHADVTPTRIRWMGNNGALLYSANGRLWTVALSGGQPQEIKFTASLSIKKQRSNLPAARFPEPGIRSSARGFMGLSLSPDGRQIGMLALGKLWIMPVNGTPKAVADVPLEASSLAWSPNQTEVAWSAGVADNEDLFATSIATGATRQLTSLPGREAFPVFSPDGRYIAFISVKDDGVLRVIETNAGKASEISQTKDLGSIGSSWTCTPQWSPQSDGLLVCGGTNPDQVGRAVFVPLIGQRQAITRFPDAPIFVQWSAQNQIIFVRHDRLWQAAFDRSGVQGEPQPLGTDAALYASSSSDGTILYYSKGGLHLRLPNGADRTIGWPLSFTPPVAESTLIRNVRIIDGTGRPVSALRDVLIERGRISRIAKAGGISTATVRLVDAEGRIMMPGLMDLHAHLYRPELLPGWLYFGVTTVRDQGASIAPLVSYADNIASAALPGPRVSFGGFQFYSDWAFDEEQGRGIEPEADPDHIRRAVDLAEAFGAQHIKIRTFRRWDINARMISEAHRRGMRTTGHCSHLLPLVAAGVDAKEHFGSCMERGDTHMYEDMLQLFRAAGMGVVPTVTYFDLAVRLSEKPNYLDGDAEIAPFLPARDSFGWMTGMPPPVRKQWTDMTRNAREGTAELARAGVTLGTGTDIWQIPVGVHWELERLVEAGLSPLEAIRAGTSGSAKILGAEKDLGTIEVGKWADLVILDADPTKDIRNTRRIWNVFQYGRTIDRPAILKAIRPR